MSILNKILGSSKFKQESYDHAHYCNGEGVILEFSPFYPYPSRERVCSYCDRIEKAKEAKRKKSKELADVEAKEHQRTASLPETD